MNYDFTHAQNREAIVRRHASFLCSKIFVEFGVCHGTSMMMWHDVYTKNGLPIDFVGFDSFQGLPEETEDKNTIWQKGDFTTNGSINPALLRDDIRIVVGFYSDSLTVEHAASIGNGKIGLVHIDCDTYSSTKTIWEWLLQNELLAKGAIIVYDDWGAYRQAGRGEYDLAEAKAHKEIEAKYGINFTDLGGYVVDPSFYEVKVFQYE